MQVKQSPLPFPATPHITRSAAENYTSCNSHTTCLNSKLVSSFISITTTELTGKLTFRLNQSVLSLTPIFSPLLFDNELFEPRILHFSVQSHKS